MGMGDKLKSIGTLGSKYGSRIAMGNKLVQVGKQIHGALNHDKESIHNHLSDIKTPLGLNPKTTGKTVKSVLEK